MEKTFGNFFEDKTILITGHTGFIGSWLSVLLIELGANIIGYALPPLTDQDNFVVTNLKEKLTNIIGDIRNYKKLKKVFLKYNPEIIFHLAAQPIVLDSYLFPRDTYDINIIGTVNVFELFRKTTDCKLLINFTTDKVYENRELGRSYKENDSLGGYDPYSSSKACSELITAAYRNSFFNNEKKVASIRCGNVIGGGDWQKYRIIPDCMRSIRNNHEIIIRHPHYVRPWQFIMEPLRGFVMLVKKIWENNSKFCGAWNFGPSESALHSVKDIVEKILHYLDEDDYKLKMLNNNKEQPHETKVLTIDSTKAYQFLGWKTVLNIDETIKYVCDWYREENLDLEFDVRQIKNYFKKVY